MRESIFGNYGIKLSSQTKLEGYGSVNFRIEDEDENNFVCKVYSEPRAIELAKEESRLVNALSDELSFTIPRAIENRDNELFSKLNQGSEFRLLPFIKGVFLAEAELTEDLLYSFGQVAAELTKELEAQSSPIYQSLIHKWDLKNALINERNIEAITDASERKLIIHFLDKFRFFTKPILDGLDHQLIHGDLNDWNVLSDGQRVTGIIDFGDMSFAPKICEVAIASFYIMYMSEKPIEDVGHFLRGFHNSSTLSPEEIDILPSLVEARLSVSVINSALAKENSKDTEYILISEKPAWALAEWLIATSPLKMTMAWKDILGLELKKCISPDHTEEKRQSHIGHALKLSYDEPIHMHSALFQYMYDQNGNTYLDAYNNIPLVGHSHPKVSEAISRQVRILNTNTRYHYPILSEYAEKLKTLLPKELSRIYFVNSGTEATDLALRMADNFTKATHKLVLELGYHGHSDTAINVSDYKFNGKGGRGKPSDITILPLPKMYRGDFESSLEYVNDAQRKIESVSENKSISAFIAEPISGCGGQVPLADGYLKELYPFLSEKGIVRISDEVQTGFGRLGDYFWGFEMHEVIPDIVIMGKPMGNAHPIAAVAVREDVSEAFDNGMEFFSSFGGNPVSCMVGSTVLDIIEEENLQTNAKEVGEYWLQSLKKLQSEHKIIGDVRGQGLFIGIEWIKPDTQEADSKMAAHIKNELKRRYILTGTDGKENNVMKLKPPLCFTKENVDRFIESLAEILKHIS